MPGPHITTIDQFMSELLEHIDGLTPEERKEWGRDLIKWADAREAAMFAKAKAKGAKVFNLTAFDASTGKKYNVGPFIGRDRAEAIQQAPLAYKHMALDATELHPKSGGREHS